MKEVAQGEPLRNEVEAPRRRIAGILPPPMCAATLRHRVERFGSNSVPHQSHGTRQLPRH